MFARCRGDLLHYTRWLRGSQLPTQIQSALSIVILYGHLSRMRDGSPDLLWPPRPATRARHRCVVPRCPRARSQKQPVTSLVTPLVCISARAFPPRRTNQTQSLRHFVDRAAPPTHTHKTSFRNLLEHTGSSSAAAPPSRLAVSDSR